MKNNGSQVSLAQPAKCGAMRLLSEKLRPNGHDEHRHARKDHDGKDPFCRTEVEHFQDDMITDGDRLHWQLKELSHTP